MDAVVPSADVQRQLQRIARRMRSFERLYRPSAPERRNNARWARIEQVDQNTAWPRQRSIREPTTIRGPTRLFEVEAQLLKRICATFLRPDRGVADAVRIASHAGSYRPVFSLMRNCRKRCPRRGPGSADGRGSAGRLPTSVRNGEAGLFLRRHNSRKIS